MCGIAGILSLRKVTVNDISDARRMKVNTKLLELENEGIGLKR